MKLNPLYESHIRRVHVDFEIFARDLNPDNVTKLIGIKPDRFAHKGDERRSSNGQILKPHQVGWWKLSTEDKVRSKDINRHFLYLLKRLLPHKKAILSLALNGHTHFDVLWESTYLYAGTGPVIESEYIAGIAALKADIGFDIYQINE